MITELVARTNVAFAQMLTQGDAPGAGGTTGQAVSGAKTNITSSALWTTVIVPLSIGIGVIVVVYGLWRSITKLLAGKQPEAIKSLVGTIVIAGLMFRLDLVFDVLAAVGNIISTLLQSLTSLTGSGGGTAPPTSTP